jgi:hypothetical protein
MIFRLLIKNNNNKKLNLGPISNHLPPLNKEKKKKKHYLCT